MPIEYEIDHARRLVTARGRGTLTGQEIFAYQHGVWSRAEVAGYDELIDMTAVEHIDNPSVEEIEQLARLSAVMDADAPPSKLAIVAPHDLAFGLGRMYATHRALEQHSTKQVRVFRARAEALAFLGIEDAL